mmetsp:Transcript_11873/g.27517  ORF Transcript_11873/g.27517 Transcript_11873/m.27517 type:complete len:236 (+) Transcript_11873:1874-2581(+)
MLIVTERKKRIGLMQSKAKCNAVRHSRARIIPKVSKTSMPPIVYYNGHRSHLLTSSDAGNRHDHPGYFPYSFLLIHRILLHSDDCYHLGSHRDNFHDRYHSVLAGDVAAVLDRCFYYSNRYCSGFLPSCFDRCFCYSSRRCSGFLPHCSDRCFCCSDRCCSGLIPNCFDRCGHHGFGSGGCDCLPHRCLCFRPAAANCGCSNHGGFRIAGPVFYRCNHHHCYHRLHRCHNKREPS